MKADAGQIGRALDKPDAAVRLILLYGPDESGSRALAARIDKALGSDAERIDLSSAQLKGDPALLADEAASISLFGGARHIRVDPATDESIEAAEALLEAGTAGNPVVLVAGNLRKDAKLVKLALASPLALAFASYLPEGQAADRVAIDLARAAGLRLRVLNERACAKLGMGCLLAVGRASPRRPRMLVLELPGKGSEAPLAICGKGVCFDTGGLNIKTGDGMLLMRKDMGGAAAALCALAAATGSQRRTVRAYLPLVENAISGEAFRPGDVLRAMDGTTVEIGNTDAEGRLILADAIALARREGAGRIVSVATLTGAAMTALGRVHVPLMATDDSLADDLLGSARATGEKLWRLPLDAEHRAMVRGQVATLNNAPGGGEAGCITAGAFVAHFAGSTPFAHLDISPASWMPKPWDLGPPGATGTIVTTLARLACG